MPSNAREGDVLIVKTAIGNFAVPLHAKAGNLRPGKQIHVDIPVPLDYEPIQLLVVEHTKLTRDNAEVEAVPEMYKLRIAVPGSAKPRDALTIFTQVGQYDLHVPDSFGRTIEVEVPVEPKDMALLGGRSLIVVRLLLNGVDTSKPSAPPKRSVPMASAAGGSESGGTRRVAFQLPKATVEGDILDVQTELGIYQIMVPPKAGRSLEARLPVPADCDLPALRVAWVRKSEADAAVDTLAATSPVAESTTTAEDGLPEGSAAMSSSAVERPDRPQETSAAAMQAASPPLPDAEAAHAAAPPEEAASPARAVDVAAEVDTTTNLADPERAPDPCEALARACRCLPAR